MSDHVDKLVRDWSPAAQPDEYRRTINPNAEAAADDEFPYVEITPEKVASLLCFQLTDGESPDFTFASQEALAARGYVRINRGTPPATEASGEMSEEDVSDLLVCACHDHPEKVARIVSELEALRARLREAEERARVPFVYCPECNSHRVAIDETGCCATCGTEALVTDVAAKLRDQHRALAAANARAEELEGQRDLARREAHINELRAKSAGAIAESARARADKCEVDTTAERAAREKTERERDEAARLLGVVVCAGTLAPGERLKDAPDHAVVSAITGMVEQRDQALAERDSFRGLYARQLAKTEVEVTEVMERLATVERERDAFRAIGPVRGIAKSIAAVTPKDLDDKLDAWEQAYHNEVCEGDKAAERLRHAFGITPDGRSLEVQLLAVAERLTLAERERDEARAATEAIRNEWIAETHAYEQILGKALGYPAPPEGGDSVVIGPDTLGSLCDIAAERIGHLEKQRDDLQRCNTEETERRRAAERERDEAFHFHSNEIKDRMAAEEQRDAWRTALRSRFPDCPDNPEMAGDVLGAYIRTTDGANASLSADRQTLRAEVERLLARQTDDGKTITTLRAELARYRESEPLTYRGQRDTALARIDALRAAITALVEAGDWMVPYAGHYLPRAKWRERRAAALAAAGEKP